jgi:hypothetical protein
MTIKSLSVGKIIIAVLFLLCPAPSPTEEANIRPRHVRLTWTGDENALRYEVVVEQAVNGNYLEILKESTEASSVVISLLPGSYRYRLIPYDLLNHPRTRTEWKTFEIPAALTSEPEVFSPDIPKTNLETNIEDTLFIHDESTSSIDELIEQTKPFETIPSFFWLSWATFTPLYGELIQYFGFKIFPLGLRLGFDMILLERGSFNGGMELAASWFYIDTFFDEHHIEVHTIMLDFNFLIQKQFSYQRATLSFRIGMGLTILANNDPSKNVVGLDPLTGQINLGISFLWLIKGSSYIETGIDFSHLIGWAAGSLRPWISFGIRF